MDGDKAFLKADFDWVVHVDGIWSDLPCDVAELHSDVREELIEALERTNSLPSPIGYIITGEGGSGKTHLLGALRRKAFEMGAAFVSVDLTDVHDFYELLLNSYVQSMMQADSSGTEQYKDLLAWMVDRVGAPVDGKRYVAEMSSCHTDKLPQLMDRFINLIHKKHPGETIQHQDVLRALILLNRENLNEQSVGYTWMQGHSIDEESQKRFSFIAPEGEPRRIILGLSWFFALRAPILLVLDQIDAIVGQHNFVLQAEKEGVQVPEHLVSQSILTGIAGGLAALNSITRRTLVVMSCLDGSIKALKQYTPKAFLDRYHPERWLRTLHSARISEAIIAARVAPVYENAGFTPPYPTWPFHPDALAATVDLLPRELLQRCEQHRLKCRREGAVTELRSFAADPTAATAAVPVVDGLGRLDAVFEKLRLSADPPTLLDAKTEDTVLAELLTAAARCLVHEKPRPETVDALVDTDFPGTKTFRPLHARIRTVHHDQEGLEKHFCLRALQHTHANAFTARMNAALTCSGIDRDLQFRRLVVFRTTPLPQGPVSQQRMKVFSERGGILVSPTEDECRTLFALREMTKSRDEDFTAWLRSRRPVSRMAVMQDARLARGADDAPSVSTGSEKTPATNGSRVDQTPTPIPTDAAPTPVKARRPAVEILSSPIINGSLHLGHRVVGTTVSPERISIPLEQLRKHAVVLAGAGSGKTVFVRRIVEDAALLGVPSIILDVANDLSRMGEAWPEEPTGWATGDSAQADMYFSKTQTVIWTPGVEGGNPMSLAPLPDFASVIGDADELNGAVTMAREALASIVAQGRSAAAQKKLGVLTAALHFFAERIGEPSLEAFAELLSDLPDEAQGGISDGAKLGGQMADSIRAQIQVDPLLRSSGTPLDPAELFGIGAAKTRLSVINVSGLPSLAVQQQFVNQLAMSLFSWIKRNPAPAGVPLRGLFVIDEAKDFAPSQATSVCKSSLQRLAAQARKYGLGLIFATQAPKDLENTIVSNCSTHIYGKASSPAAIETIRQLLMQRGGKGDDIGRLSTGRFYVHNADVIPTPTRIATPLCLSHHPSSPPSTDEVIAMARRTRG